MSVEGTKSHAGEGAAQWLADWDAGKTVESISMGGISQGYEQCIQITAFEVLRHWLEHNPDPTLWREETNPDGRPGAEVAWEADRDAMELALHKVEAVQRLGLTGAQWGAAVNLATIVYVRGVVAMQDDAVRDRHILVQRGDDPMAGMTPQRAFEEGIAAGEAVKAAEGAANG
jgi:hypothetical protein